ncbi:porin family protein [Riemerella anatipestifer]|uniref:Porin family protein n=1 Tax=Riemerella anatipestifer TaxID=34085 RepID=A0AAP6HCQ0_RIEAN|nr:porin family protein [Riemerella anatipestifer]MBT0549624.1 PorT family protein [Riemerella anatipestifer]MBT0550766.1 PorT family protein [Riemerella anatipestifer]MBT0553530.1 PorT family protein [Riemerella anatipestifer]MBT0556534.1 PorT family protein [Riemerella anatipestifer]MBT0560348.1 PorT family protein [Riemerella anatipestifer]
MKKILLAGAIALFGGLNAQVKYGLKAGYNLSNVSLSTPATSVKILLGNKSGFNAGGFVEYGFGNNLSLQGEVLYSNVGAKLTADVNKIKSAEGLLDADFSELETKKASATISMHQVSVPVSLKYSFDKFSILGGFSVNFNAGVSTKIEADGTDIKKEMEAENEINLDNTIKSELASANFGLHLGAEYMFTKNMFVDARYNCGVSSLNKNYTDFAKLRQRYFQIGLGYKF